MNMNHKNVYYLVKQGMSINYRNVSISDVSVYIPSRERMEKRYIVESTHPIQFSDIYEDLNRAVGKFLGLYKKCVERESLYESGK